ncbi:MULTISPECIES: hypothetical protein [unclassified Sphingomonas]|uniref:hypothetical protein n=1 Tax=unclassified Sphingomonas TaxID=196159 RepID=UPI0028632F7E|nr:MULTISPECIES: hypothetical protein [unclassified Sphingomonas]MDR6116757.1 hypothetical protein [Sphingomonas sp. SORGH_AS_0789]MDR6151905.1 hypothetical protein [Sphingomonas sp. SORGH_AS_0742]
MTQSPAMSADPNPERLTFLPIDPFAAHRQMASRIAGLGGEHRASEPGYAFQSLDIYPVLGPVRFTLHFHGLIAATGTLTVRIHAFSLHPGTAPVLVKEVDITLPKAMEDDGIIHVDIISRRNMGYMIGGAVNDDTDARADALSLILSPREREAPSLPHHVEKAPAPSPDVKKIDGWQEKPELATIQPVLFACPVSQPMTAAQLSDPLTIAWNAVLHQAGCDIQNWEDAFILQALHYYDVVPKGGSGLGMGRRRSRLPAYFAGRGCAILSASLHHEDLPDGDPGLALELLEADDLCSPHRFYEVVHLTLFDRLTIPPSLTGFDFLWSTDAYDVPEAQERLPQMLRNSMRCLRPGGLAIHMLRYRPNASATGDTASAGFSRPEIERMALSLIADGQEVAQLNFATDPQTNDKPVPFALIARRIS